MNQKIPSEITGIQLNDATFKGSGAKLDNPTFINFFFGNNGSGKSTISKAIRDGRGITYAPGKSASDYQVFLYDEDYIEGNFHSYHGLDGVYILDSENKEAIEQLDAREKELKACEDEIKVNERRASEIGNFRAQLKDQLFEACWEATKKERAAFKSAMSGFNTKRTLGERILKSNPVDHDVEELTETYGSAFKDVRSYSFIPNVGSTDCLDAVIGVDWMEKAIVNSAETPFAEFIRSIGATDWVKTGHEQFSHAAGEKCPYCQRTLDEEFESTFKASFDRVYEIGIEAINLLLPEYRRIANELYPRLKAAIPQDVYPGIDLSKYNTKLSEIHTAISDNITKIRDKIASPSSIFHITMIEPLLVDLDSIVDEYNDAIRKNNAVVAEAPKKRQEFIKDLFEHFAYQLQKSITTFNEQDSSYDAQYTEYKRKAGLLKLDSVKISAEISELNVNAVDTEHTKDRINSILHDTGMQGFSLENHGGDKNVYTVLRPDGSIADNLSEGEKNLVAFLYFYFEVQGSKSPERDKRQKIVVIDDPVSSMDSNCMFVVSSLIRNMIEVCRNNADGQDPELQGKYIQQIFILTHNAFFHQEITYKYVSQYQYVSLYLIQKRNNRSSVELCQTKNPKAPTEWINQNPVHDAYTALWSEYHQCQSVSALMSVMRKIIEYYFLQMQGYDGADLEKHILVEGRKEFTDEQGVERIEELAIVRSMLAYISSNRPGIHGGLHYVEDSVDLDVYRALFEKVFDIMHESQHYQRMWAVSF